MPKSTPSAAPGDKEVPPPLLRDPPSPPGYANPLECSAMLEDLVEAAPRHEKS